MGQLGSIVAKPLLNDDGTCTLLASIYGLLSLNGDLREGDMIRNGKQIGTVCHRIVPELKMQVLEKRSLIYRGPKGEEGRIISISGGYQGRKPRLVQSDSVLMVIELVKQS